MTSFFHPLYFQLFPQGATVTNRAHGLDLSKYDIFFEPSTATGQLDFVIQRASYGTTQDEKFLQMVPQVMTIPMRGAYHYLQSWLDYKTQADKFLSIVQPYDFQFYCCDFESATNTMSTGFAYLAWQFIQYIQKQTGKPCLLYTSPSLYTQYIYASQKIYGMDWNTVKLWVANWLILPNPDGEPTNPTGRTAGWTIFQYTNKGDPKLYGVADTGECDLDVYNGTPAQMAAWLGVANPLPLPDVVTTPHDGIQRVDGERDGWQFVQFTIDPNLYDIELVYCSPLETVPQVQARTGALLAVNAGEWDRVANATDYTVSNGTVKVDRVLGGGRPSVMITR